MVSDASLIIASLLLTVGELASSRSAREFKENFIMRNSIDAMFFLGTPLFMKLLAGSTTIQGALEKAGQNHDLALRVAKSRY